ncbi:copper homeostasis protein CutC [Croceiramulus getboli]|nr:copper homeostasis protein CutC [Flavobacteriaceae bacterium YJPT1-3]
MQVEVCANSLPSALVAQEAGADRIELCSQLNLGGVTPSAGLISECLNQLRLPVHVLIRPRAGSFVYDFKELKIMIADIQYAKKQGSAGIVSGAIQADSKIDLKATKLLIEAAYPLPFTFHRAFDEVPYPDEHLQALIELGVTRILTSGQAATAADGLVLLNQLKAKMGNQIEIMPGKGIDSGQVELFKSAGFSSIHLSATGMQQGNPAHPDGVSDLQELKKVVHLAHQPA